MRTRVVIIGFPDENSTPSACGARGWGWARAGPRAVTDLSRLRCDRPGRTGHTEQAGVCVRSRRILQAIPCTHRGVWCAQTGSDWVF